MASLQETPPISYIVTAPCNYQKLEELYKNLIVDSDLTNGEISLRDLEMVQLMIMFSTFQSS